MCFHTIQQRRREGLGFTIEIQPGVYQSNSPGWNNITLIVVNKLRDERQNWFLQVFSQRKNTRHRAYRHIMQDPTIPMDIRKTALLSKSAREQGTKEDITMSTISLEWFQKELSQIPADVVAAVPEDNPTMQQYREQMKNQGIQQGIQQGAHASLIRAINNIISVVLVW